ncbi:hypothetical protein BU23DRAFT_242313 [Bimuria novae-zelandiae CBS 107.79]|uniref:Uncharacterized protein n=1 Tax=Bimuria novae-zelandiae CBS 107.79 TaxID=1447943 RepID=A0A6A5V2R8_9PLEO|nr:hypothetical protein BU23DRAFT_242313 [Bimuria novae-zelandiae CBS 107.79]
MLAHNKSTPYPQSVSPTRASINKDQTEYSPLSTTRHNLATMFSTLFRLVRNPILAAIVIAIFVHEPAFQLFHDGPFYIHVVVRVAFLYIRGWLQNAQSRDLSSFLCSYARTALLFCAPIIQPVLPWANQVGTNIVRLSPRLLCYVNSGVVEVGKYLVDVVMDKEGTEWSEMWKTVGKEVAGYCMTDTYSMTHPLLASFGRSETMLYFLRCCWRL